MENNFTTEFYLEYECDGTLVDGEIYTDLARARDIAFDTIQENQLRVVIMRCVNGRSFVEESLPYDHNDDFYEGEDDIVG